MMTRGKEGLAQGSRTPSRFMDARVKPGHPVD
jgi:hypothetical protein